MTRVLTFSPAFLGERLTRLARDGVVAADAASLGAEDPAWATLTAATGVQASLYIALRKGDEVIGIRTAGYRQRTQAFQPLQRRVADGIAQLGAIAIENARLFDDLTKANRVKSEFVAAISHELRTPLNVIIGYKDLLAADADRLPPEHVEAVTETGRYARHLLDLITAVLDLSRLEAGRAPVMVAPVPIAELLAELTDAVRHTHAHAGTLDWRIASSVAVVHTDPVKLRVLLRNLIDNAAKFTARGTVTIEVTARDHGVEFAVTDTGIEMPSAVRDIIFEPFRQGDGSFTRRYGGIGLGLYVARRLVEVLRGRMEVVSEVGHGSAFRGWVPDRKADLRAEDLGQVPHGRDPAAPEHGIASGGEHGASGADVAASPAGDGWRSGACLGRP